jgi:hypothetical protein
MKSEAVEWKGRVYRRYPNSKDQSSRLYFKRSFTGGASYLHRDVWEDRYGPIPPGWHVHHRDENPANNAIENLECLPVRAHKARHPWSQERLERQAEHLERVRPLTKTWHASPEGRAKHVEIGGMAYANFVPEPKPCDQCGKIFKPRKLGNIDRFCSNVCKSAFRRASGVDDVEVVCACCGAGFMRSKYSKQQTCSRACANRLRGSAAVMRRVCRSEA